MYFAVQVSSRHTVVQLGKEPDASGQVPKSSNQCLSHWLVCCDAQGPQGVLMLKVLLKELPP